ncbi:hypothetical protein [Labedaea rhizosphaerae]|uniref:hypothetical protein n=1 Tax=Labedaea rhizosphaerae TaxID=598644 RepID=UPI00105B7C9D|nr:hypothetical protein [Labedaea rhizosphaerae]
MWPLLGRLWGYAIVVGVVAMLAGTVLAGLAGLSGLSPDGAAPLALRLAISIVVAGAAGWWSPNVIRFLRRVAVRAR